MSTRTALEQTRWLTFGVLLAGIWTVLIWFRVYELMDWQALDYVGPSAVSGVVGLVVMAGAFAMLVALFAEMGETEPAPEAFPPE